MADAVETLSLEEVGRVLGRLRQPDLLRLAALAQTWVSGLPRRDAGDLLNEALARILSGQRPWPADVPLPAFLSQVMRSIASQWRHEDVREPLVEETDGIGNDPQGSRDDAFADITERMRAALADDLLALGIFNHILTQTSRTQACDQLDLSATGYDTARRRMIRTLQRQFNPGWIL